MGTIYNLDSCRTFWPYSSSCINGLCQQLDGRPVCVCNEGFTGFNTMCNMDKDACGTSLSFTSLPMLMTFATIMLCILQYIFIFWRLIPYMRFYYSLNASSSTSKVSPDVDAAGKMAVCVFPFDLGILTLCVYPYVCISQVENPYLPWPHHPLPPLEDCYLLLLPLHIRERKTLQPKSLSSLSRHRDTTTSAYGISMI